ncbi:pYEATS domain-containing protein [Nostoc sp. PCC 9305]|uniref:pYEATS domain-containing protein n=1 Tax=Nostoc sp. PCC 9305 TaxID=296636 RepID=UPI0039C5FF55
MKISNFQTIYIAQTSEPSPSPILKKEQEGVNLLGASWVPFWQTIVWLVFWVFIIRYINKNFSAQISSLFNAFIARIQDGSPVKFGNFVELDAPLAIKNAQVRTATSEGVSGITIPEDINEKVLNYQKHSTGIDESVYLIHTSEVIVPKTLEKRGLYRVKVWLEAYSEVDFNNCIRVTYRLHNSFKKQIIATESHNNQFELWLNIWGEFTVIAYVERKNQEALWLTRYLDLPGRPPE